MQFKQKSKAQQAKKIYLGGTRNEETCPTETS